MFCLVVIQPVYEKCTRRWFGGRMGWVHCEKCWRGWVMQSFVITLLSIIEIMFRISQVSNLWSWAHCNWDTLYTPGMSSLSHFSLDIVLYVPAFHPFLLSSLDSFKIFGSWIFCPIFTSTPKVSCSHCNYPKTVNQQTWFFIKHLLM